MGFGNAFIITWATFVTVYPYPADLTDYSWYNSDLSIPEPPSDTVALLVPIGPPRLDGTDDGSTSIPMSGVDTVGNAMIEGDRLSFYDESSKDALADLDEAVGAALAVTGDSVAANSAGCVARPSRHRARSDMTLADSEPKICPPSDARTPPLNPLPGIVPTVTPWECSSGLKPFCCIGSPEEQTGWAQGCTPYGPFEWIRCNPLWTKTLCCQSADADGVGYKCVEIFRPEEEFDFDR